MIHEKKGMVRKGMERLEGILERSERNMIRDWVDSLPLRRWRKRVNLESKPTLR